MVKGTTMFVRAIRKFISKQYKHVSGANFDGSSSNSVLNGAVKPKNHRSMHLNIEKSKNGKYVKLNVRYIGIDEKDYFLSL